MKYRILLLAINLLFAIILKSQVLEKISTYKCSPKPLNSNFPFPEAYDARIKSDGVYAKVPPTFVDVLVSDIWDRIGKLKYSDIKVKDVIDALNIYLNKDYHNIAGFRPWTHWNFIRSLSTYERQILAIEISLYIKKYGVKDGINNSPLILLHNTANDEIIYFADYFTINSINDIKKVEETPTGKNVIIIYDKFYKTYEITYFNSNNESMSIKMSFLKNLDNGNSLLYKDNKGQEFQYLNNNQNDITSLTFTKVSKLNGLKINYVFSNIKIMNN